MIHPRLSRALCRCLKPTRHVADICVESQSALVLVVIPTVARPDVGFSLEYAQCTAVLSSDWGFDLRNVDSERVWLVHGDQDIIAPVKIAQWIDEKLGGGRLNVLEGKTHFTIWKDHSEMIFRQSAEAHE